MVIARQSTARTVIVGPVLDADGVAVTDAVVGDFQISKNGGAPAALNGSATLTHRATGHYSLALTATDLDTVGQAELVLNDGANACPVKVLSVVEEAIYDALFAASATGLLPANVTQFGGSAGTFSGGRPEVNATHWGGTAVASARPLVDVAAISGDAAAADNLEAYCDGTTPQPVNVTQFGGSAGTFASGRPNVNASHLGGTSQTGRDIGASVLLSSGTGTGQVSLSSGAVLLQPTQTGVTIPTVTTLTNAPSDSAGITTLLSRLSATRAGYLDNLSAGAVALEASLQALITTIGASAAGVASAVWSAATRVLTAGTNIVLAKGTGVTGFTDLDAAGVRSAVGLAAANLDTQLADLPTAAEAATAVRSELTTELGRIDAAVSSRASASALATVGSDVLTNGTVLSMIEAVTTPLGDTLEDDGGTHRFTANALEQAPSGGGGATAEEIAEAVWSEDLAGYTTPGEAGHALGNVATGTPPSASAIADEVQTRTIAAVTAVGSVTGSVGSVAGDVAGKVLGGGAGSISGTGVRADVRAWNGGTPGNLDANGFVPGNLAAINGSTTRATTLATALDNDRLDAPISSRLAAGDYSAPPSAATVASQVRTELATELARVDAAVSTRATPAQVNTEADQALADVGLTSTVTGRIDAAVSTRATPAQVATEAAAALAAYDPPTLAELEARTLAAASYATAANQATILGYIDTEVAAIIAAIAALHNLSEAQVLAQVQAALTATVADSVPADGTRPSVSSGIYMLVQFMLERAVSGTSVSVRKPDGSTALFALTLNDATTPTTITRSS